MADPIIPADWRTRLQAEVDRSGRSMRDISLQAGRSETFLRDMMRREREPGISNLIAITDALGIPLMQIVGGVEDRIDVIEMPLLPIETAGPLLEAGVRNIPESFERITVTYLDPDRDYFALRLSDEAMNRIAPPGSVIIVDRDDTELVDQRVYVTTERGTASCRQWRDDPQRLEPLSTNPDHPIQYVKESDKRSVIGRVVRTMLDL